MIMWKFINESVDGTSHRRGGVPCQDASSVTTCTQGEEPVLVLACADGAGSASKSDVGSKRACEAVCRKAVEFFNAGGTLGEGPDEVRTWVAHAHADLVAEAERLGVVPRELACTLLVAVLGANASWFAQIGDGSIVILDDGIYRPVFWPQSGEYQNTTFFLTEPGYAAQLQYEYFGRSVDEIALFSDGLQPLALNYAMKAAHGPFFTPMFKEMRRSESVDDLAVPLRSFLDSEPVNDRTDDDKTLVLATRVPASADATV